MQFCGYLHSSSCSVISEAKSRVVKYLSLPSLEIWALDDCNDFLVYYYTCGNLCGVGKPQGMGFE